MYYLLTQGSVWRTASLKSQRGMLVRFCNLEGHPSKVPPGQLSLCPLSPAVRVQVSTDRLCVWESVTGLVTQVQWAPALSVSVEEHCLPVYPSYHDYLLASATSEIIKNGTRKPVLSSSNNNS